MVARKTSRILAVAAIAGATIFTYAGVVASLVRQWAADDNYSHGFFVFPLALYFAWERRDALARAEVRPRLAGALVIGGSLLIYLVGVLGVELFLTRVSLVGVIAGCVLFLYGWQHLRILALPIAFLLLMVPLPAIVLNQITLPLQFLASQLGEGAIAAAGVPVLREGNILHLPSRSLEVVEACSGIRSLTSLLTFAIVLGFLTERGPGARAVIAVAAIPLAIVANAIRVAGTGLVGEWISAEAADGFFHTFSGWLMFVIAAGGLLGVQQALAWARRRRAPATPLTPALTR